MKFLFQGECNIMFSQQMARALYVFLTDGTGADVLNR